MLDLNPLSESESPDAGPNNLPPSAPAETNPVEPTPAIVAAQPPAEPVAPLTASTVEAEPPVAEPPAPSEPATPPATQATVPPAPTVVEALQAMPVLTSLGLSPKAEGGWQGVAVNAFFLALIAIGIFFRFSWVNWNQSTNLHPDEYGLTSTLTQLEIPKSLGDYFNTRLSSISPYQKYDENGQPTQGGPDNRMRWGQWPIIILRFTAEITDNTDYENLRLMGRRMSALADTLALFFIFLIGTRLFNRRVGLLAAALSALAVMQIQQSHFMTADNFGVLFTAMAMYCAVRVAQGDDWKWYAGFGVAFGMALASRINLLPLIAEIFAAAFIAYFDQWLDTRQDPFKIAWEAGMRLALALVMAFLAFRVTHPMAFRAETGDTSFFTLEPNFDWTESMAVAQSESSGIGGGPPGEQWTNRTALVFPFVNMVWWGMGLPLGLAAWAGITLAAWRMYQDRDSWRIQLLPFSWAVGYFLFMGTRWVKSIRYFLPIYPFMALFAAWLIWEVWRWAESTRSEHAGRAEGSQPSTAFRLVPTAFCLLITLGTLAWAWGFTNVYRSDNTRIQAAHWIFQNVPAPFNVQIIQTDGQVYNEPVQTNFPAQITESPMVLQFRSQVTGTVSAIALGHARSLLGPQPAALHFDLAADPDGRQVLASADLTLQTPTIDPRGDLAVVAMPPVLVNTQNTYYLRVTAQPGNPVEVNGSTLANESWDEGLPMPLDGRNPFGGLYRGLTMEVRWLDAENKRQMFLENLAQVDYIILPSQRAIWSASRLPATYPMTMEYYRALFDGRMGFELVAQFQNPITLGPLQLSDIGGTWAWGRAPDLSRPQDKPFNFNPLAAEEAFSVYDHAPVWIFKKRADFSLDQAREILGAIDLSKVINQGPREATSAPSLIMLPADRLQEQRAGGTWSEMFDLESLLNQNQPLAVLAWWLTVLALGWLAFPITFLAFGGLADRGYPLAKSVALLVVTWMVWVLGSYQILSYSRFTIGLCLGVMLAIAVVIVRVHHVELFAYLKANWRYILIVEGVTLALFALDLFIRYQNPDLWHPSKGGEKPMDFSYFNAILKSTSFPPYDPWLAGGYINYYYYGFVIVGIIVKLLGIAPTIAYNLILPTLFALLGVNAFGVGFNLLKSGARSQESGGAQAVVDAGGGDSDEAPVPPLAASAVISHSPISNPLSPNAYLAGLAAALFIIVLGNLGQVKTFIEGFQLAADRSVVGEIVPGELNLGAIMNGMSRVFSGEATIPMGTDAWYWNATRIIPPAEGEAGPITEFPLFTFLYADLHAHMIDLPFTVLALAWAVAYLQGVNKKRGWLELGALWFVGGLAFGVTRPTNTWDFPVYLALGVIAVAVGQWWRDFQFSRENLIGAGVRVALLGGLAYLLYAPYGQWYASGYEEVERWKGSASTLESYLYIHGLFFFIIVTFLLCETRLWFLSLSSEAWNQLRAWQWPLGGAGAMLALALLYLWSSDILIGLIALPLMVWAGLLILRSPDQMPIEKRVILMLFGTGLALTLTVELVVLKGDISRMNTVFKFYLQVWTLFSIAAAASLAWVWTALNDEWRPAWRDGWTVVLAVLVACAALYSVTAAQAKMSDRFPFVSAIPNSGCQPIPAMVLPYEEATKPEDQPYTLDGIDYMQYSAYCDHTYFLPLKYDYDAIRWMQKNVAGSPVIVEAQSFDLYKMSSRYTWNTGLPDVVGWDWHQRQQRAAAPTEFITRRGQEVTDFYNTLALDQAVDFIRKYDVEFIIVGPMERAYYPPQALTKFDEMVQGGQLRLAYENPGVKIYQSQIFE